MTRFTTGSIVRVVADQFEWSGRFAIIVAIEFSTKHYIRLLQPHTTEFDGDRFCVNSKYFSMAHKCCCCQLIYESNAVQQCVLCDVCVCAGCAQSESDGDWSCPDCVGSIELSPEVSPEFMLSLEGRHEEEPDTEPESDEPNRKKQRVDFALIQQYHSVFEKGHATRGQMNRALSEMCITKESLQLCMANDLLDEEMFVRISHELMRSSAIVLSEVFQILWASIHCDQILQYTRVSLEFESDAYESFVPHFLAGMQPSPNDHMLIGLKHLAAANVDPAKHDAIDSAVARILAGIEGTSIDALDQAKKYVDAGFIMAHHFERMVVNRFPFFAV